MRTGMAAEGEERPVTVSTASDRPEMTPALAKVFAGIFQRLLSEENARERRVKEGAAA
jgi:hypothetical protein